MVRSYGHRATSHRFLHSLTIVLAFAVLSWVWASPVSAQIQDRSKLVAALDSAAQAHAADSTVAGVSVAVSRRGDMLLHEGYGQANLEFDVPMPKDAVFEIGSVTKQFTAAAILQLAEKDSLDLDAPITEYLPDYNTRGHRVTVRHLLHHTSGIRSYTNTPRFSSLARETLSRDTVLTLMQQEPFRFAPGAAMSYSNSGYYLLGQTIEAASGTSYAAYIEEHLLEPVEMDETHYCDERAVVDGKAQGYSWAGEEGFQLRKRWAHQTWSYAAGALCSTTGDLVRWLQALHGREVISDSMYAGMTTPGRLADGTELRYGMGLAVSETKSHRIIGHGGSIDGFVSATAYFPGEDMILVVLQNTRGPQPPSSLTTMLADLVLGPGDEPISSSYEGDLSELTGRYSGSARGRQLTLQVRAQNGHLLTSEAGSDAEPDTLRHISGPTWQHGSNLYPGLYGDTHLRFVGADEGVDEIRLDAVYGHYVLRRVGGP